MSSNHNQHDDKAHDQTFVRTFAMVLAALFSIFAFCIFAANLVVPKLKTSDAERARVEARIQPTGVVITDPALLKKASVKHDPLTGEQVVATVCSGCHGTGMLGAPKIGDKAAWGPRGSLDTLVASAIKGKNSMPARGGNPDLTDDEIKLAIQLMTK